MIINPGLGYSEEIDTYHKAVMVCALYNFENVTFFSHMF